jgi:hypothetical protein
MPPYSFKPSQTMILTSVLNAFEPTDLIDFNVGLFSDLAPFVDF